MPGGKEVRGVSALVEKILSRCREEWPEEAWEGAELDTPCWVWEGGKYSTGYAMVWDSQTQKVRRGHRVTYSYFRAEIPDGLSLDHLCRNRDCCNPWHLDPVTNAENAARGERATAGHCPRGHSEWGKKPDSQCTDGYSRYCRACKRENDRRRHARKRAAA